MTREPLIHIGYHKTGTTWLQRRVFPDAGIGFTQVSPRHLVTEAFVDHGPFDFDVDAVRSKLRPFEESAARDDKTLVISQERLSGDPMQGSLDARSIADRLHATFPEGRVLIVVRDQRAVLLSFFKQVTTRSLRRERLDAFLEHRLQGRGRPSALYALEYDKLISYYRDLFGADRILVLAYEMTRDPIDFVGRIAQFVGLPRPTHVDTTGENVGITAAAVAATRYLNAIVHTLNLDRILIGPTAKESAIAARMRLLGRIGSLAPDGLSKRIEEKWYATTDGFLGDRYAKSNRLTSDLSGIDLGALGYVT